jgi:signal transduction histidine kinase/DNA-binding response OmpR family regulator
MNTAQAYDMITGNIFLIVFWTAWWFKLLMLVLVLLAAIIFHLVRVKKMKGEKADVERQLLERNELLLYASRNEQRALEKVSLAEKNKTALLSKINHEIRTPMNGVMGMTSLLNQTDLTPEQKDYTSTILNSGEILLKVVNEIMMNDILEYSKVESGKELEAKDIDLYNCIEEVLDVFADKAARAGIDLLYNIESNVPVQIVGDLRRLRQILMNLIENSVKVTSKGEIFINVQLVECKEDNRVKLAFEVRDTGAGMSADKTKSLLTNLSKANASSNNVSGGVGLIICKKLVELMGGSINVESKEGKGTVFNFTIYTKAGMQPIRSHVHSEMAGLEDKKILIVDDNASAVELMRRQLEGLKVVTSLAMSGAEAEDILSQVSFDLVLTDLTMQDMSGIELATSIRKKYPFIPIILLNPVNDERYKDCVGLFGEVLSKPLKQRLLLNAILGQLRHKDESGKKQAAVHKLSEDFSVEYPLNILIAEDNPVNQKWTSKILSKLGYQPEIVNNGKEVLEVVSVKQYDLILMDVQMPEMDGMEATRMIRLCLEAQPVIIAMTANVMQGDRQDCIQSGMDDYISKPVELNQLVGMLEKWALLIKEKKQFAFQSKR